MNLKQLIDAVDRSPANEDHIDLDDLFNELGLDSPWFEFDRATFESRVKGYWVRRTLCTDTHVGIMAFYLDDQAIGASEKYARKNDTAYRWVSKKAFKSLRDFAASLFNDSPEERIVTITEAEDYGTSYQVTFTNEIRFATHGIVGGVAYAVNREATQQARTSQWGIDKIIVLDTAEGPIKFDLCDVHFPYNLAEASCE